MRTLVIRSRPAAQALAALGVMAPLSGALAVSFAVAPEDLESGRSVVAPACAFRMLFGHPCPTCGMTRAFAALSHGRFAEASAYNVAGPVVYALFWVAIAVAAAVVICAAVGLVRQRRGVGAPSPHDHRLHPWSAKQESP